MDTDIVSTLLYNKDKYAELSGKNQDEILESCGKYLSEGVNIVEFIPLESDFDSVRTGHKLRQLCSIYNALYIVKSRCGIAKITSANGVLLTQDNIAVADARNILGHDTLIGTNYLSIESDFILSDNKLNNIKHLFLKNNELYIKDNTQLCQS